MTRRQARRGGAWWALRGALGIGLFVAGLDKFFDLLATWSMYLSPVVELHLPVATSTFLHGVGILEMLLGLLILFGRLTEWRESLDPWRSEARSPSPVTRPWARFLSPPPGIRLVASWRR
jgi:hypothetical protein